jgi:hypothetical protein
MALFGQVSEEGLDFRSAHVGRMTFFVIKDVTAHPIEVSSFGAIEIVFGVQHILQLIEKFFGHKLDPHRVSCIIIIQAISGGPKFAY